jgi:hypothetical protein
MRLKSENAIFLFGIYIIACVGFTTVAICEYFETWKIVEVAVVIVAIAATLYLLDDAFDVAQRRNRKANRWELDAS